MPKTLGQVVAIERDARVGAQQLTEALGAEVGKDVLLRGSHHHMKPDTVPADDPDFVLIPDKDEELQLRTHQVLREHARRVSAALDLAATKDWADCTAKADVILEGATTPLLEDVPVSQLLSLERSFTNILAMYRRTSVTSTKESWTWDATNQAYVTVPEQRVCTDKKNERVVMFEPTQHQPGQAMLVNGDVRIGMWHITKLSGALLPAERQALIERTVAVLAAVKQAITVANHEAAPERHVARPIFEYILSGIH